MFQITILDQYLLLKPSSILMKVVYVGAEGYLFSHPTGYFSCLFLSTVIPASMIFFLYRGRGQLLALLSHISTSILAVFMAFQNQYLQHISRKFLTDLFTMCICLICRNWEVYIFFILFYFFYVFPKPPWKSITCYTIEIFVRFLCLELEVAFLESTVIVNIDMFK